MDVAGLIASFATGTYAVTRHARGTTTRGRTATGTATTVSIRASVSPATGRDLERLPEGRRTRATKLIFTATELLAGGQGESFEADTVSIEGEDWEIQHVALWSDPVTGNIGYSCLAQAIA